MVRVSKSVTIKRPPRRLPVLAQFENLPRFMLHLEVVRDRRPADRTGSRRRRRQQVEWDAEIVDERPDELITWRALPGSDMPNEGSVRFLPAPADRGTEVQVELRYDAPAGKPVRSSRSCSAKSRRSRFETTCGGSSR